MSDLDDCFITLLHSHIPFLTSAANSFRLKFEQVSNGCSFWKFSSHPVLFGGCHWLISTAVGKKCFDKLCQSIALTLEFYAGLGVLLAGM